MHIKAYKPAHENLKSSRDLFLQYPTPLRCVIQIQPMEHLGMDILLMICRSEVCTYAPSSSRSGLSTQGNDLARFIPGRVRVMRRHRHLCRVEQRYDSHEDRDGTKQWIVRRSAQVRPWPYLLVHLALAMIQSYTATNDMFALTC